MKVKTYDKKNFKLKFSQYLTTVHKMILLKESFMEMGETNRTQKTSRTGEENNFFEGQEKHISGNIL